jgi:hypothetical protein
LRFKNSFTLKTDKTDCFRRFFQPFPLNRQAIAWPPEVKAGKSKVKGWQSKVHARFFTQTIHLEYLAGNPATVGRLIRFLKPIRANRPLWALGFDISLELDPCGLGPSNALPL